MEDYNFYDIQVSGQEDPLATYDTYEEAICGLYKAHCQDPKMDVYMKEYKTSWITSDSTITHFIESYELDVLGAFRKETA